MEQLAILNNVAGLTAEQQEAAAMHFEIVQAAKTAVNSLLDLGRKLKRMRDSGRYKDLGFASFAEYTEAAVGIKQRQAYNYIQVVESLPARLIEENAAAGVTKLALLAKQGTIIPDDSVKFLEDQRAYKAKLQGNGCPMDKYAFLLLDVSELESIVSTIVEVAGTVSTTVTNTVNTKAQTG